MIHRELSLAKVWLKILTAGAVIVFSLEAMARATEASRACCDPSTPASPPADNSAERAIHSPQGNPAQGSLAACASPATVSQAPSQKTPTIHAVNGNSIDPNSGHCATPLTIKDADLIVQVDGMADFTKVKFSLMDACNEEFPLGCRQDCDGLDCDGNWVVSYRIPVVPGRYSLKGRAFRNGQWVEFSNSVSIRFAKAKVGFNFAPATGQAQATQRTTAEGPAPQAEAPATRSYSVSITNGEFKTTADGSFTGVFDGEFDGNFHENGEFNGTVGGNVTGLIRSPFQGTARGTFRGKFSGKFKGKFSGEFNGAVQDVGNRNTSIDIPSTNPNRVLAAVDGVSSPGLMSVDSEPAGCSSGVAQPESDNTGHETEQSPELQCERSVDGFNYYFASSAHFPLPDFNDTGLRYDSEGAVIYENMRFVVCNDGQYELQFRASTPMTTQLRLQLLIKLEDSWHTVTLPTQTIFRDADTSRLNQVKDEPLTIRGRSDFLVGRAKEIEEIKRRGTARFGSLPPTR